MKTVASQSEILLGLETIIEQERGQSRVLKIVKSIGRMAKAVLSGLSLYWMVGAKERLAQFDAEDGKRYDDDAETTSSRHSFYEEEDDQHTAFERWRDDRYTSNGF